MQRRTAVAAASAISVSLVSAVIAGAASFGALGFAAQSPSTAAPTAVTVPAPNATTVQQAVPSEAPAPRPTEGHESDD